MVNHYELHLVGYSPVLSSFQWIFSLIATTVNHFYWSVSLLTTINHTRYYLLLTTNKSTKNHWLNHHKWLTTMFLTITSLLSTTNKPTKKPTMNHHGAPLGHPWLQPVQLRLAGPGMLRASLPRCAAGTNLGPTVWLEITSPSNNFNHQ